MFDSIGPNTSGCQGSCCLTSETGDTGGCHRTPCSPFMNCHLMLSGISTNADNNNEKTRSTFSQCFKQECISAGIQSQREGAGARVKVWGLSDVDQSSSVAQLCPTLYDPMDCSTPGFRVHHQLPQLAQTHVHWVIDAVQPSQPLSAPSPPAFNLSQHQGLFKCVSSSHQVDKVLKFQLQHQSFQWIFRTDFL